MGTWRWVWLGPVVACTATRGPTDASSPADDTPVDVGEPPELVALCAESDAFGSQYDGALATWRAQDDAHDWPDDPLVFAGSSSIRRWEDLAWTFRDHRPLQRGFGGAQLAEVAQKANELVARHDPRGVVVFAGTNDIAFGVDTETVIDRARCLRARLAHALGPEVPLFFLAVTPTPSRWSTWPVAEAVHEAIRSDAEDDPGLVFVDVATPFLETGTPPSSELFVGDRLHLSEAGYAMWGAVVRDAVDGVLDPWPPARPGGRSMRAGEAVRVDLGPVDGEDGELTPSPDHLGAHWNNWPGLVGGGVVLPGERLVGLVTTEGEATDTTLTITGGFLARGRKDGGLVWPSDERLGDLAVGSATGDYLYALPEDSTGGFMWQGLDPQGRYRLRVFAGRADDERGVTEVSVRGDGEPVGGTLQTSGPGSGAGGSLGNDDTILVLDDLVPDAWGQLHVDVSIAEGSLAYVSLVELSRR